MKPTKQSPTSSIEFREVEAPNIRKYPFFLVKVKGESLWPELIPGKRYFATSMLKPNADDYVIFKNPKNQREIFVKKVRRIIDGCYEVGGTVPWSSSSEEFGPVPNELVLGKIVFPSLMRLSPDRK